MIDFRYHLVSIIAVFLALAVGLVVGATALAPGTEALLKAAEDHANKTNASLIKGNRDLQHQVDADQLFAQAAAARLLSGLMTGEKVVLVAAPNADAPVIDGVTKALHQAGAIVTGEVSVTPNFLLTGGRDEEELTQLAQQQASQAGVTLPAQSSAQDAGQQAASRVLAASLLTAGGSGLSSADSTRILSAFSSAGYVTLGNGASSVSPATLAVLIAPGGTAQSTGSQVLVTLAAALKNAGSGTVMVGGSESVGSNSAIAAEITAGQVSTVDNADTETGQIMTVQALKLLLLDDKQPNHYGIGPGAAPSPAPTPSSSVTSTATPNVSSSSGGHK